MRFSIFQIHRLIMANKDVEIPLEPHMDLNTQINKFMHENDENKVHNNPIQLFIIESPYNEIEQLNVNLNKLLNRETTTTYT